MSVQPTPDRPIAFWDCHDDADILSHNNINDAVNEYLEDLGDDEFADIQQLGGSVTVYGYARMIAPKLESYDIFSCIFEGPWMEYIGEDGPEETDRMKEAAQKFADVMHEEFTPYACEQVTSEDVHVATWIAENRPAWNNPG